MRITAYATLAFTSLVLSGAAVELENEGLPFAMKNMLGIKHKGQAKIDSDDTEAAVADEVPAASTVTATKAAPAERVTAGEATDAKKVTD